MGLLWITRGANLSTTIPGENVPLAPQGGRLLPLCYPRWLKVVGATGFEPAFAKASAARPAAPRAQGRRPQLPGPATASPPCRRRLASP